MPHTTTIAAFDFDKTITDCDSLIPFLIYTTGYLKTGYKLLWLTPYFLGFALNCVSRQRVKEKVLTSFFQGSSQSFMKEKGLSFAAMVIDQRVKPEALERLKWHQKQGHRCILISASIDIYLAPWALKNGFTDLICSSPEVDDKGMITGKIRGLNCWGPEKKRRLLDLLGPKKNFTLYMYGDSEGDRDLLEIADYPFFRTFPKDLGNHPV
jgi:phosphatidylglycerophosphatase C